MPTTIKRTVAQLLDTGAPRLDAAQQDNERTVGTLSKLPMTQGIALGPIDLPDSVLVPIDHKLGRRPVGWIITDAVGAGAHYVARVAWDTRTLQLRNSGGDTVSVCLWVY